MPENYGLPTSTSFVPAPDLSATDLAEALDTFHQALHAWHNIALPVAVKSICAALGVDYRGELEVLTGEAGESSNIVILRGVSVAAAEVAQALRADPRFEEDPRTDMLSVAMYLSDGASPIDLPLVKRIPKDGYKTPHWVPVFVKLAGT